MRSSGVRVRLLSNPDFVIIGAGAAGIAAAHTLIDCNHSVTVIESSSAIGGRAQTDLSTFGVPYDIGAHWLHYAENNYYCNYGKKMGFEVYPDPNNLHCHDAQNVKTHDYESLKTVMKEYYSDFENTAADGADVSVFESVKHRRHRDDFKLVEFVLGPWVMGKQIEEVSSLDYTRLNDSNDWFCKQGFGSLVAHYGSSLPVSLETKAVEIDWSGSGVTVRTTQGDITAQAVVVTVSTGVLNNNDITFKPSLPVDKYESFHAISMGYYEHIALQFSNYEFIDNQHDTYMLKIDSENDSAFGALLNASGKGITYLDIGGQVAKNLACEDETTAVNLALDQLTSMYGNEIRKSFCHGATTAWISNQNTRGSYASARPGMHHCRAKLRESVGERIYFAGEACHPTMWASVAGAHSSGQEVARIMCKHPPG